MRQTEGTKVLDNVQQNVLYLFDLADIFPGYKVLVNVLLFIVSLVDCNRENRVIAQNILTEAEVRVLLPLLENPTGCQQAVLQASYFCTSEFLLKSLLFSDANTNPQWNK